jgi:8-oxo-dGTP diphosphatase
MQAKQVFSAYDRKGDTDLGQFKHCPFCGTPLLLQVKGGVHRPVCPNCGFVQFRNPVPGVVVVIEKDKHVLLGKRRGGFGRGKWGLPQGHIEFNEDFLTAAIREVKEETGLDVEIRSILNVVSNFLSPGLHTLAIILLAGVIAGETKAGDDLENLEWIPLSGPLPEMAFEADEWIIERYHQTKLEEGLPVKKLTLDRPVTYQIKVPEELSESWSDWVGEMTITVEREGDSPPVTTLTGAVDQAALQDLLRRLYSLGIPLISVNCVEGASDKPLDRQEKAR